MAKRLEIFNIAFSMNFHSTYRISHPSMYVMFVRYAIDERPKADPLYASGKREITGYSIHSDFIQRAPATNQRSIPSGCGAGLSDTP